MSEFLDAFLAGQKLNLERRGLRQAFEDRVLQRQLEERRINQSDEDMRLRRQLAAQTAAQHEAQLGLQTRQLNSQEGQLALSGMEAGRLRPAITEPTGVTPSMAQMGANDFMQAIMRQRDNPTIGPEDAPPLQTTTPQPIMGSQEPGAQQLAGKMYAPVPMEEQQARALNFQEEQTRIQATKAMQEKRNMLNMLGEFGQAHPEMRDKLTDLSLWVVTGKEPHHETLPELGAALVRGFVSKDPAQRDLSARMASAYAGIAPLLHPAPQATPAFNADQAAQQIAGQVWKKTLGSLGADPKNPEQPIDLTKLNTELTRNLAGVDPQMLNAVRERVFRNLPRAGKTDLKSLIMGRMLGGTEE